MSEPKLKIVKISKSEFEALSEKVTNTMYFVDDGLGVSLFFGEKNVTGASGGGDASGTIDGGNFVGFEPQEIIEGGNFI